jgi:transcriptional regulator with XRE-family HTH domain
MKKPGNIKIGKNLQKLRRSHGYTQEKLAESIDCSARYISDIEQDKSKPSYENLIKICNVFKIGLNDIFSEYLDITENKALKYSLSGFETLTQNNKDTIEHLIMYFNQEK